MNDWSRAELKSRAKACLGLYYGPAFGVSLIAAIAAGGAGSGGGSAAGMEAGSVFGGLSGLNPAEILTVAMVFLGVFAVVFAVAAVIQIFVGNVIQVGVNRFFMESRARRQSAGIGRLLWGFTCGSYGNVVKIMFLMNVKILLWSLLLVVPGIIKSYEYQMVPYILTENPDMSSKEVFALSRQMMTGNKWRSFVLDLSFFGWILFAVLLSLLLILLPFVGMILGMFPMYFLLPYINATTAELYAYLRGHSGRADLRGYGVPERVTADGYWN